MSASNGRLTGKVKWFNEKRGWGFIEPCEGSGGRDVYVHYTCIQGSGYRTLKDGQRVSFILEDSDRGPKASSVCQV